MGSDVMRAVVLTEPGPVENLVLRNVPIPNPQPGWVLIRVMAFGLNRSELFTRLGFSGDAVSYPRILGIEAAGEVMDAPGGEFEPGTQVVTMMGGMGHPTRRRGDPQDGTSRTDGGEPRRVRLRTHRRRTGRDRRPGHRRQPVLRPPRPRDGALAVRPHPRRLILPPSRPTSPSCRRTRGSTAWSRRAGTWPGTTIRGSRSTTVRSRTARPSTSARCRAPARRAAAGWRSRGGRPRRESTNCIRCCWARLTGQDDEQIMRVNVAAPLTPYSVTATSSTGWVHHGQRFTISGAVAPESPESTRCR